MTRFAFLLLSSLMLLASCSRRSEQKATASGFQAVHTEFVINSKPAVRLSGPHPADAAQPAIVEAELLPGRGMNVYQLKAHVPGKGIIHLIVASPLEQAPQLMTGGSGDEWGNMSFKMGGAILAPFANRIRGKVAPGGYTLDTLILGKPTTLHANWQAYKYGAERHAMHGLVFASPMDTVELAARPDGASASATLGAGDFNVKWPSTTFLMFRAAIRDGAFRLDVTAKNSGSEPLPMGIGWQPLFLIPSGNREQARLRVPAKQRVLVNNYDDVFPTGELAALEGSLYNFAGEGGAPLGKLFLDDCFTDLKRNAAGHAAVELIDPAAKFGLRVTAFSPEISAFHILAPVDKAFAAIEPQFNLADPFGAAWKGRDTGMKVLRPGGSVTYSVEVRVFVP